MRREDKAMRTEARMTTLCYIERDGAYLIPHRASKIHNMNKDKWIGMGGHSEHSENPEECPLWEVREETGLTLTSRRSRGPITLIADGWGTEYMCLYTTDRYEGRMVSYDGGVLEWVKKEDVLGLNLQEKNKIFFRLMNGDRPFFSLKLPYRNDCLVEAALDGQRMELFDILDNHGERTGGVRERTMVHLDDDIHGTAHIWIVHKGPYDGFDLLLQKRNRCKGSYPGCCDVSSAGHVQAEDSFLPTTLRELKEESGIEALQEDLEFADIHTSYMEEESYGSMFKDSEHNHVYIYRRPMEAKNLRLQEEEVESVMWTGLNECMKAVREAVLPNCLYMDELELLRGYLEGHPREGVQGHS